MTDENKEEKQESEGSEGSSEDQQDQNNQSSSGENPESKEKANEESLPSQTGEDAETTFVEIPVDQYRNLQEKAKERDEYLEKLRKVSADYDNYQKRMRKRRKEDKKYATREVIDKIVPILDDFDQAFPDDESKQTDLVDGFRLIYKKFLNVLEDAGVEQIDEEGVKFDPNQHEAASSIEKEGIDKDTVEKVLRKGYRLHDRVLRPARVVIARPPESEN